MIKRMFLPLLALAAVGAVVRTIGPDVARYMKIRSM